MQGGTSARLYDSSRTKIQTTPVRGKSPKTLMITAASSATANIMAPWLATQDIQ